jgi:hypothetical protein
LADGNARAFPTTAIFPWTAKDRFDFLFGDAMIVNVRLTSGWIAVEVNMHAPFPIFELLFPDVFILQVDLPPDLLIDLPREADALWFGDTLQPRGDVNPIAVDTVLIEDDISLAILPVITGAPAGASFLSTPVEL